MEYIISMISMYCSNTITFKRKRTLKERAQIWNAPVKVPPSGELARLQVGSDLKTKTGDKTIRSVHMNDAQLYVQAHLLGFFPLIAMNTLASLKNPFVMFHMLAPCDPAIQHEPAISSMFIHMCRDMKVFRAITKVSFGCYSNNVCFKKWEKCHEIKNTSEWTIHVLLLKLHMRAFFGLFVKELDSLNTNTWTTMEKLYNLNKSTYNPKISGNTHLIDSSDPFNSLKKMEFIRSKQPTTQTRRNGRKK